MLQPFLSRLSKRIRLENSHEIRIGEDIKITLTGEGSKVLHAVIEAPRTQKIDVSEVLR